MRIPIITNHIGVPGFVPDAPAAPSSSNYTVPGGATTVSTIAQLETALSSGTPTDIYLQNGTYSRTAELVPGAAHRLYGQSPTGVILNFGIRWNYMSGWKVKGMTFNIPDTAHAAVDGGFNAAILNWLGDSRTISGEITDCYIDGANAVAQGIQIGATGGMTIQRCVITNCTDEGIRISDNTTTSTSVVMTLTDLNISGIYRSSRGSSDGVAEAGLWVGHRVTNPVARIKVRNCGWMGLNLINMVTNTTFTDLDVDDIYGFSPTGNAWTGTGIYVEHFAKTCTIKRFWVGHETGHVKYGMTHEWDNALNRALSASTTFPVATVNTKSDVYDTTTFAASGTVYVGEAGSTSFTYTGRSGTQFTGCSGGTGTFPAGTLISSTSGGYQASTDVTMQDGYVRCLDVSSHFPTGRVGIYLDKGTLRPTIQRVVFVGMDNAAIRDRSNTPQATSAANSSLTQSSNDFGGIGSGASQIAYG